MAEPAPSDALLALLELHEEDLPETDGLPMPDSDQQLRWIHYAYGALEHRYADRDDVAVSGDIFMYYLPPDGAQPRLDERGRAVYPRLAPDVLVSFGVPKRDRLSYVVADEGKPPDFVLEVASRSTWRRDRREKRAIYQALGVREYFIYDARPKAMERLFGFRLRGGAYEELPRSPIRPGGPLGVRSEVLGLWAHVDEERGLRWYDAVVGEDLRTLAEAERRGDSAEHRADAETRARQLAERERDEALRRVEAMAAARRRES